MRKAMGFLAGLALMLSLAACAGTPKSEGCCSMMGCGDCKAAGKDMKCEKKDPAGGCCCSKGATEGKPAEGNQH